MKVRIISAIIMVAVFVPLLIIGDLPFALLMAVLGIGGLYELLKVRESKKKIPRIIKLFAYVMVFAFCMYNFDSIEFHSEFDYRVMALILSLFLVPIVFVNDNDKYNFNDALYVIGSLLFVGLSFNLIVLIRNFDIHYIIYLLLVTTITDTFALFSGLLVGKHKMCPKISPKKTWEGLVGGVLMGTFVATAFFFTVINANTSLVFLIFSTAFLCLVGQIGDLVFSSIKRYYDVKDFSEIIPGHGGILDRFDSLIFVTLAFILLLGIL